MRQHVQILDTHEHNWNSPDFPPSNTLDNKAVLQFLPGQQVGILTSGFLVGQQTTVSSFYYTVSKVLIAGVVGWYSTPAIPTPWRLGYKLTANLVMSTHTEPRTPTLLMRRWCLEAGCFSLDIFKTEHNTECGIGSGDLSGHQYHNVSRNLVLALTEFTVDLKSRLFKVDLKSRLLPSWLILLVFVN